MEANNWKPGDKALCVKIGGPNDGSEYPPLRLNYEYVVNKVAICGECGAIALDVGLSLSNNTMEKGLGVKCECGAMHSPKTGIHWCAHWRFVKKDDRTIEEQIEEAVEKEDYELATKLRNQSNT